MVNDVEVRDAVEEEVAHPAEKVTVKRRSSASGQTTTLSHGSAVAADGRGGGR